MLKKKCFLFLVVISLFSTVICFANEKEDYEKNIKNLTFVIEKGTTDNKMYEARAFFQYMLGRYDKAYVTCPRFMYHREF